MHVIERRHQPDVLRQQHAVAENVSTHVADADHGEILVLDVLAEFAKVPLHRFPCPARGDPHLLVIVSGGSSRGECVTQPETPLHRDAVGDIGEGGGALVRGDDEVGVILVATHDARRVEPAGRQPGCRSGPACRR